MTLVDVLAFGLPFTLLVNWPVFVICASVARKNPGIRSLIDRRWLSLVIALSTTGLTVVALAYAFNVTLGPEIVALLFTVPAYLFTAINFVFLFLTLRGKW